GGGPPARGGAVKRAPLEVRPRQTLHVGHVTADALLVEEAPRGPAEMRARALTPWAPGTVVLRVARGLLLLPAVPLPVRCEAAPALPLVRLSGALSSAPLTAIELE